MSYATALRNARQNLVRDAIAGGTLYICSGAKPAPPRLPQPAEILSQHTLPSQVASATNGTLAVESGIGIDTSANNTGLPGWTAIADSTGAMVACKSTSELALILTYPAGDTQIVAGREVRVTRLALTEGNA